MSQSAMVQRLDLMTAEAGRRLDGWDAQDQKLYRELVEDAASDLQRELLGRSLAMGHSPTELHSFADFIRRLADPELHDVLDPATLKDGPLEDALRACADPLLAWQRRRGPSPAPADLGEEPKTPPQAPALGADMAGASEPTARHQRPVSEDGSSRDDDEPRGFADDLFNDALRGFGFHLEEHLIDDARVTVDRVVPLIAEALARAIPVPVVLGSAGGDYRRYALMLQVSAQSGTRSFQLHDPFAQETVWVTEADILGLKELSLTDKQHRRLTAVALPRALGSALE